MISYCMGVRSWGSLHLSKGEMDRVVMLQGYSRRTWTDRFGQVPPQGYCVARPPACNRETSAGYRMPYNICSGMRAVKVVVRESD